METNTTPSSSPSSFSNQIEWILKSFEVFDGDYKRDAVEAAVHLKEDITPHLLAVLEDVIRNPQKYAGEESQCQAPFYAAMLLSFFKEERAYSLFLQAFGLPGELSSEIFGDLVTDDLPVFLYRTCSGNIDGIKQMVLNKQAYSYCRSAAGTALVYCVAGGFADRHDILKFFSNVFTTERESSVDEFLSFIACCMNDLYPDTVMGVIESAYKDGLISEEIIDREYFIETIESSSPESSLEKVRDEMSRRMHESIHDYMEWWYCFNSEKYDEMLSESSFSLDEDLLELPPWEFQETVVRTEPKVGRNDPCPCGSGKKYKKCCLH